MSKMKNYMMEIEDFCNGYFYGVGGKKMEPVPIVIEEFIIDEVIEDVGMYFKSDVATRYARQYLTTQLDEI